MGERKKRKHMKEGQKLSNGSKYPWTGTVADLADLAD